jgi:UDP-N-acetylglucosamine 2-epimerase (non-hydrolysing)
MLAQVLDIFEIEPHIDLALMTGNQTLNGMAARMISGLDDVFATARPDRVLVHGDTTTAMAAAMAAFHRKIPVAHVEAGLRTGNMTQPWPEEMNRRVVDVMSDMMFAPTMGSKENLEREQLHGRIVVTGNTVIDALLMTIARIDADDALREQLDARLPVLDATLPLLLVTGHRRESFGDGFARICAALGDLAAPGGLQIVYPVHLNPNVLGPVRQALGGVPNVHLIAPLDYLAFVRLMQRASVILTDSGGIQEEAPSLGKPVLVMRDVTERPEALIAGTVQLVGTDRNVIRQAVQDHLERIAAGGVATSIVANPYGDGQAASRIVAALTGRAFDEFDRPVERQPLRREPSELTRLFQNKGLFKDL